MIDLGIAVVGGIFYLTGQYAFALLLIVLAIISGVGAALMALANPQWYARKRMGAGLDVDLFNPWKGIATLVITKVVTTVLLSWIAWYIAEKAGYL